MEKVTPAFTNELIDQRVEELTTVRLKVTYVGKPRPEVKWFLNNKMIQRSDSIDIETTEAESTLVIRRIRPEQHGKYTCKLTNEVGTVKSKCWIQIIGKIP